MRWPLKVSAENGTAAPDRPCGFCDALRRGRWGRFVDAAGARRHIPIDHVLPFAYRDAARRRDSGARPRRSTARRRCRSSSSRPTRASFASISSPTRKGSKNSSSPPAYIRRGSGTGAGRHGSDRRPGRAATRKDRLRQAPMRGPRRGIARPGSSPISWDRVARRPFTNCAVTMSGLRSVFPIQSPNARGPAFQRSDDSGPEVRSCGARRGGSPMPCMAP